MAEEREFHPLDELPPESPRADGETGVTITTVRGMACCQVLARQGCESQVTERLGFRTAPGRAGWADDMLALPLAPRQWLLLAPRGRDGAFAGALTRLLDGVGHVSEQSHARALLRVSGPRAAEVLSRECRLDLDPRVAPRGFVAQTAMADIGILLHRRDDIPSFDLLLYPGYALSFRQWLDSVARPMQPAYTEECVN